jgi:hypothetical protein
MSSGETRYIRVTFWSPKHAMRMEEDYGPFTTSESLVAWLDQREDDERFGPRPLRKIEVRYMGAPDLPVPVEKQAPARRARTKKAVAAS